MLGFLRIAASLFVLAHGLVHATIWPGAPAYGGGQLGWTGATWWSAPGSSSILVAGRIAVWLVIALHVAAAAAILFCRRGPVAPALLFAAEIGSLLVIGALWPGLTPTPMTFWRGPVISAALLPIVWLLWAATASGERFGRTWTSRHWPSTWGSTAQQRSEASPAMKWIRDANFVAWRGADVDAPAELAAAWLAQVRVAPYSYDWLDNHGRQSPRARTDQTPVGRGDPLMDLFVIVETDDGGGFTATSDTQPPTALTYTVRPLGPDRCRIEVAVTAKVKTLLGALLLAYADVIMMRRQLLNLAALAAEEYVRQHPSTSDDSPDDTVAAVSDRGTRASRETLHWGA